MPMPDAPAVLCEGIAKSYGGRRVLHGFDLVVHPGEVFGLVGANGGSKTTILRILSGLLQPDAGRRRVFGLCPAQARRRIGYLPQGQALHAHLTVSENLGVRAMLFDVRNAAAVDRTLDRFGLVPHARTRVAHLSGGWARRAGFAAALIHDPDLLLLDEPTVGLDAAARQEVWRHILHLAAQGVAIVVSTHDLAEAERVTRLAFLVEGGVRAQGTVAEVIRRSGAQTVLLDGPDPSRAATDALATPGIDAAYPSAGMLRVVTRHGAGDQVAALAARHGLAVLPAAASLDDAAQALLHGPWP